MTRRSFLVASASSGLSVSLDKVAFAQSNEMDDADLSFEISKDRTRVRVSIIQEDPAIEDKARRLSSRRITNMYWDIDAHWFGPEAQFVLYSPRKTTDPIYRLSLEKVRYGQDKNREVAFDFWLEKNAAGRLRWVLNGWSTLWSPNTSPSLFSLNATGDTKDKLDFRAFIQGKAQLEAWPKFARLQNTFRRIWTGLIKAEEPSERSQPKLRFHARGEWTVEKVSESAPDFLTAGVNQLKVERISLRWCFDSQTGRPYFVDEFASAEHAKKTELEVYCDSHSQNADAAVVGWAPLPATGAIMLGKKARNLKLNFDRAQSNAEAGKTSFDQQLVVRAVDRPVQRIGETPRLWSELAFFGSWKISVESSEGVTGPFDGLHGRFLRRTSFAQDGSGRIDSEVTLDLRWSNTDKIRRLRTPFCGMGINGVITEAESDRKGDVFRNLGGYPVRAALASKGTGLEIAMALRHFDATAELREADFSLPDAHYSRLDFDGSEIRYVLSDETFDAPAGNSFVRLDAPKNDPVPVRLDLRRARLYAARIDSLASLKFRFNGLALELSRNGLEIVTNSTQCGTWNEPSFPADAATADGKHTQRADASKAIVESRPLLVVEFPPQHVMEEAFFLPGLPKLPNVKSAADEYVKGEKQGEKFNLQKVKKDTHKPEIEESTFVIDVNDDDAISVVLTRLKTTDERAEFRRIVSDLKYDHPEDPEDPEDHEDHEDRVSQTVQTFRDFRDAFEKKISENNGAFSRELPKDQKIYIGPIALDPDVRILARSVQQDLLDKSIDAILDNLLEEVKTQAEKLLEEPGPEIKNHANDLASALALEGLLESAVPSYQAFRTAYRDFMLDLITNEGKYELGSYYLEYVIELSENRAWIRRSDTLHPLNNGDHKKKFRKLYVETLKGRDTPSGLAEARLSQPSRLAFRVNCRDGLAAARSQVSALDALQDSQLGLGRNRLGFTLRDLTNWSSMELSVVRRAANVYATGIGGRLDARSGRRLDFSEEGRLDALGFTSGDMVTAATRLAEVQRSMQDPPGSFETSIEIPSRLQLSTNDSAVFLTQQPVPAEIFSSTQETLGSGEITDSRRLNGTIPLWSARLVTDGLDAGLRAVHSPDFRPDFVWTALADLQGDSLEYTGSDNTKEKAVSRMPGVGAPPQGPIAPWLIGPEETTGRPADALKLFRAGMSEGAGAYFDLNAEERAFCHAVLDPAKQIERPKGLVPKIVDFLCRRGHFTKAWWQDANDLHLYRNLRKFRTALSANDRHQLVVLSSAHGLPVVGRRGLDGELVAGSSQVDVEQRYELADVLPGSALYRAKTLDVSELMLTALGGSIRLDTSFEPPVGAFHLNKKPLFDALSVERWQQWSVLGRDVFTEIVYKGFLLPFGHRASLVKVTERTFLRDEETGLIRAYLRQKMFIRCSKPEKRYPAIGQANGGRSFPADRLVILTVQTPDIIDPLTIEDQGSNSGEDVVRELSNGRLSLGARPGLAFWPRIALAKGAEVRFELDLNGTYSDLPMIFVDNVAMNDQKAMAALTRYYYSLESPEDKDVPEQINPLIHRRTLRLSGEKIRYAPEIETGSASIETEAWTLELEGREKQPSDYPEKRSNAVEEYRFRNNNFLFSSVLQGADQPPLYPVVAATRIRLRQNERLTGSTGNPVRACFDGRYIDKGFPEPSSEEGGVQGQTSAARSVNNAAQIFLTLADQPEQNMGRKGDNTGGMFRPAGSIVAFSRSKGPVTRNAAIEEIKEYFRRAPLTSDMDIIFRRPSLAAAYHTDEPKEFHGNGDVGEGATPNNLVQAESRQALGKVKEIYEALFSTDAKILGLVRVQDLLRILASSGIAEDPATGIPQFVEKVRYGAGQAAQAAGDATGFVRDQVLKPLLSAVTDIRRRWDKIEADLADGQRVFDENNIEPIKLAEVFPELANGLAGLQSALLRSSAITDDIAFSLSLAEVYEAGQRFISALQATAANPIARIEDVVVDRVSQIRQFGPSIRKDLDKYTEVILKDLLPERSFFARLSTGEKEIIAVQLSLFLIPEKEDAEGKPFLQLPIPVPVFTSPPFDQVEEDDKKILEEISSELYLSRSQVRELARDLLERLLSGQKIEDILEKLSVIEDLQSNLEAKLEDAFDIAAEKFEEDAKKELRDEIFRILKEYEVFIASAERLIAQLKPYYQRFARIKDNYDKLRISLNDRDALGAAQHALPIVEEVTGPLDVNLASLCHPDSVLVKAFDEAAQSVSLEKVSLCSVRFSNKDGEIEDARLCRVGNDNALDENYVGVGTGKVLEALEDWHEKLGSIRESLKKTSSTKLAKTFKEAEPLKIGDKKISDLDGFDETVARLENVFESTESTVAALHRQIAELHCLLINDTLRLNALEAEFQNSLKDIGNVCRIGSTPAQKVRRLQDHVNAFLLSRQKLLKNLTERLSLSVDQIVSWLKNSDVQIVIVTAGLGEIIAEQLEGDEEAKAKAKEAVTEKLRSMKSDFLAWNEQLASSVLEFLVPASAELATYAGNLAKTSESAAQKLKTIKEQVDVFGYIVRIDLQGLDKSLDSLRVIDSQLSEIAQNIKDKWEAVDPPKLSAIKTLQLLAEKEPGRELVPLHFFTLKIDTTPSVHLLNKLDREIEKFVADLATLFERLIVQVEAEVLTKLDELALKSILRDFEDRPGATSSIQSLYEKLNSLKNDALNNNNVPVALRPALRQALMIAPRDDDFGHTVKEGVDRLTRDVFLLNRALEKPISNTDNRRYLATFIREWQDGKSSTPLRIALNFKDVVVDLVKGQMFQQLLLAEVRDQIEQYLLSLIPAKIEMSYDFSTPLSAKVKDATFGIFEPEDGSAFTVETRLGIDLSQNFKPEVTFRSESRIGPFSINLVGDFKAVKLIFGGARFVTQSGAESRFDVKYVDYEIGEQLDFVQALQSFFTPRSGSGFFLMPIFAPIGIEAGYDLPLGTISIGNVSFFNVSISASARLPFEDADARFRGSLSRRLAPFTISAAPYGGSGFFAIEANTKGIVGFEAAFEYGGAGAFAFGPLNGQGRIMAGVYIRQSHIPNVGKVTEISGTFFAGGSANIWIFSFGSSFHVRLGMVNGDMSGEAVYTFSFSLGLKDFDFSVPVWKKEGKGFSSNRQASLFDAPAGTRFAERIARSPLRLAGLGDAGYSSLVKTAGLPVVETKMASPEQNWGEYRRYFDNTIDYQDEF